MKNTKSTAPAFPIARRKLYLAIAAQMLIAAGAHANPTGGVVVTGDGQIDQSGLDTTVTQTSERIAIDWTSFNIQADERVQFIQPGETSVALNRILGSEASQIFGRLDANGHVILMNPNGVLFGESATVNVGGLVASGLAINPDDFMNGDFALSAVEGMDGAVINQGIIHAATGGNVALIGKSVENQGLISAKLGSVTLAASKEAVLTFDNQGLLGIRVTKEILQNELGVEAAVANSGEIKADGGRILLTGSVSQDIFSRAVNSEGLNAKTSVVMHDDGSFTLGAGANVVNTGTLNAGSDDVTITAGHIAVLGENVNHSGTILAASTNSGVAGNIELHSRGTTLLTATSTLNASAKSQGQGGNIKVLGDRVGVFDSSQINASGVNGGGDIHIGGGFQGKNPSLRNASRTVVGKNTLINADALENGNGGEVIIWADKATAFTGEINVRGGAHGGDGGFVEVSGKENLKFNGKVDRTAVEGKSGTLLLDPEVVVIVPGGAAAQDDELSDGIVLFSDEPSTFFLSDAAISRALASGDVFIRASNSINADEQGVQIAVDSAASTGSLVLESGGSVTLSAGVDLALGLGNFIAVGSISGLCADACSSDITLFNNGSINTGGSIYLLSSKSSSLVGANLGRSLAGDQVPKDIYIYAGDDSVIYLDTDLEVSGSFRTETLARPTLTSIALPSGATYEIPDLKVAAKDLQRTTFDTDPVLGRNAEITVGEGFFVNSDFTSGAGVELSNILVSSNSSEAQFIITSLVDVRLPEIGYDLLGSPSSSISVNVSSGADIFAMRNISTSSGAVALSGSNLIFGESTTIDTKAVAGQGDITLTSQQDIVLPTIISGGNLDVESQQGSITSGELLNVIGETHITASVDINLSGDTLFSPEGDVHFNAGRIIRVEKSSAEVEFGEPLPYIKLAAENSSSFFWKAGSGIIIYDLELGQGDFVASANNGMQIDRLHAGGKVLLRSVGEINWKNGVLREEGLNPMDELQIYSDELVYLPAMLDIDGNFTLHAYSDAANILANTSFISGNGKAALLPELSATKTLTYDGRVDWWSNGTGSMFTNGGEFFIRANVIDSFGAATIDTSSAERHGDITLIARDYIQAPRIRYTTSTAVPLAQNVQINIQAGRVLLDRDFDFNRAGMVDFQITSDGDVILGVIRGDQHDLSVDGVLVPDEFAEGSIFDSLGGDGDQLNLEITAGGIVFQKYGLFTGGGNYTAIASEFNFNDAVQINTDFSNSTQDALLGNGSISIQALIAQDLFLPSIVTQTNCGENNGCGALKASGVNLDSQGDIRVFGDANFDLVGNLRLGGENNRISSVQILSAQNVQLTNSTDMDIAGINAQNLRLDTQGNVSQSGSINISGESEFNVSGVAGLNLEHAGNDFNLLTIASDSPNSIRLNDLDDLALGNIEAAGTLQLTAGAEGRISQNANSIIDLNPNALLILNAGHIDLGESASRIEMDNAGVNLTANRSMSFSGVISGLAASQLKAFGSTSDGIQVDINEGAIFSGLDPDVSFISLGAGNDVVNIAADVGFDIDTFAGDDTISILGTGLQISDIDGGDGQNTLSASGGNNIWEVPGQNAGSVTNESATTQFSNIGKLIGSGDDTLQASDTTNAWTINAANSGQLVAQENATPIIFEGIANLIGGAGSDAFNVLSGGSISGSIDGGAGTDTLQISDTAATNSWQLGLQNSLGLVNQFRGIENLTGNANNDTFAFTAVSDVRKIEGQGGDNTLDWSADEVVINLCGCVESNNIEFKNIQSVIANSSFNNTIIGLNEANTWTLTGPDAGTVNNIRFAGFKSLQGGTAEDTLVGFAAEQTWRIGSGDNPEVHSLSSADGQVSFRNMESLLGGAGADTFHIDTSGASISPAINGGGGVNVIFANDNNQTDNTWIIDGINSGLLNEGVRFTNIQNLEGNDGIDTVTFAIDAVIENIRTNGGDDLVHMADGVTAGLLDGGLGNNVLRLSGLSTVVDILARPIPGDDSYDAINFVVDTTDGGFVTVRGLADLDTEWLIDGDGTLTVRYLDEQGQLQSVFHPNVARLEGANGKNTFVLLDGGELFDPIVGNGSDTLRVENNLANTWIVNNPNAGQVTTDAGLTQLFEGIANLIGGTGDDTFDIVTGGSISSSIDGRAGADTFTLAPSTSVSEIFGGLGNDSFFIGRDVVADNFFGDAGDDSFDVDVGLTLSGALDGGSGEEVAGDYLNLNKYTVLSASSDLESLLGFTFRNFERIDQPNNQGVYTGGDATNFWYITGANQGRLEIRDGANAGVYEFSGVHSLLGGSGEDIFIFADDTAAITTIIDGGVGDGTNTLDLSAQGLINQWLIDGANSGRVINASNSTGSVFTNIAYLIGGGGQDVFNVQAGGAIAGGVDGGLGDDQLTIASTEASTWTLGDTPGNTVTGIASFGNIETLVGSAGEDIFNVLSETLDVARVDGAGGSDTLNFQHASPVEVDLRNGLAGGLQFSAIERFITGNIGSTLIAADASNNWTLDGADSGTIRYLISTGGELINVAFDGFGNLLGGAANDQFNLQAGASVSGAIDAGAGNDELNLQAMTTDVHVTATAGVALPTGVPGLRLNGVEQLLGNGRTWLYGASDQSYTWTINGPRSGQVTATLVDADNQLLAFENLSAIVGGAHDDVFQVTVATPLISLDGGSAVSADLVDYSQVNGNLRINLATALSGQNGVLTGVEGIRGNNAGPDSIHTAELVGADGENSWTVGAIGSALADGINDGQVTSAGQTIQFLDFNVLTGGAIADRFELDGGVLLGTLNGGAGNDVFDLALVGVNTGTLIDGGLGLDSLVLNGGDAAGLMIYTAAAIGGEFDYSLADTHFKVSHQAVETIRDNSRAQTLEIRGSSQADSIGLANGSFRVNEGDAIAHANKTRIAVRSGINDTIEINDHLVVADRLTLANGAVVANDPVNSSITTAHLVLDATRDVGLANARLRTSVDELSLLGSVGDTYLQEQNGLNLAEFNANGAFDLLLLNGDLTNSAPLAASDVFRVNANNGDITLSGDNELRDDVALFGRRVELHNASTLTLTGVTAEDLILRTQRGIEGDGPLVVSGLTEIDAQGDVRLDFASNDFNRVRVTNAWNLTLVDQNSLQLLDVNASGAVVVRSANHIDLSDSITGGTGVNVTSGSGSINQNGSITTGDGSVAVSAANGAVNLADDARIVSNGGSVTISAGNGNVNMGADTRIAANGGNVNIEAAESVVVAEVVSTGSVAINAGSGSITDGNGGTTNVVAGALQSSSNTGFGSEDSLETQVGSLDITTNTGNVSISNKGDVTVEAIRTDGGNIAVTNEGNVDLTAGAVSASNGEVGGDVSLDVSLGSVKQSGPSSIPAITGGAVSINAPEGAVGEGGLRVFADVVRVTALVRGGEIFVNPGADKIEYFSGSFKFEDQLLAVEPLDDIDPAIFSNVRTYFYNDISLLLPSDQRFDEEEEEAEE